MAPKKANGEAKAPRARRGSSISQTMADTFEKVNESLQKTENVFLFLPNLIGYVRIALAFASLQYMPIHPRTCALLYSISCLLDAADGWAARKYDQSSSFGAVLDMVTDRCCTVCLQVFLAQGFPRYSMLFQLLISLDLSSHYIHMYSSLASGSSSHKKVDVSQGWLLHTYYTNRTVLFLVCGLNELFFIALYLLSFSSPYLSPSLFAPTGEAASAQPGSPKVPSSILPNPWSAAAMELARANKMDSTFPWVLAVISAPVMLLKQYLNVAQMINASKTLARGDIATRRKARLERARKTT